ncbi:redoxin domain-containing protein [Mycetohabitans sp. B46]
MGGDIAETQDYPINYPLIGDKNLSIAKLYDMIHPNASAGPRNANDNATVRAVFITGPDKKIKAMFTYPMSAGRNFDEILRLLDALQLNAKHSVTPPVNWKPDDDVIIPTSVPDEEAKKKYSEGFIDAQAVPAHCRAAEVTQAGSLSSGPLQMCTGGFAFREDQGLYLDPSPPCLLHVSSMSPPIWI